ncbi:MAG: hypothetical protein GY733_25080 [bacterium]|nr:hypothetical protein [bacterium]
MFVDSKTRTFIYAGEPTLHPAYQRLVRNEEPRGLVRELGLGIALLIAILLGFLLLPALPGESRFADVGSAPPDLVSQGVDGQECADTGVPCAVDSRSR